MEVSWVCLINKLFQSLPGGVKAQREDFTFMEGGGLVGLIVVHLLATKISLRTSGFRTTLSWLEVDGYIMAQYELC